MCWCPVGRCGSPPLVWALHEEPFDFFRYTPHALRHLAQGAGFTDVEVAPLGGWFTAAGQLLRMMGPSTGIDELGAAGRVAAAACFASGAGCRGWTATTDGGSSR